MAGAADPECGMAPLGSEVCSHRVMPFEYWIEFLQMIVAPTSLFPQQALRTGADRQARLQGVVGHGAVQMSGIFLRRLDIAVK